MRIRLARNWFTPSRQFFLAGEHEVPDSFKEILPKSAEILEEQEEVDPVEAAETKEPAKKKTPAKKADAE
jgi:hypothetical protein